MYSRDDRPSSSTKWDDQILSYRVCPADRALTAFVAALIDVNADVLLLHSVTRREMLTTFILVE